ncbi:protein argonaute-2 isoform X2 [Ceratina calcarata]|uniref:Protein argonaute-2 isoform X2 n=1 Tax=Ceratina calcarata TaxID=156304 RepID=A0AAJ7N7U8_9HYME|nr:protein argonaute-2 isoform X2 [Ceratina calcarata]
MGKGKKKSKQTSAQADPQKESGPSQQQKGSGDATQQKQGSAPPQQQKESGPSQKQKKSGPSQQQKGSGDQKQGSAPPQQQQQTGPPQQQAPGGQPQQQAWGKPPQQQTPGGQPQQQAPRGQPQAWGRPPQQQMPGGQPQQQEPRGQPQQQAPRGEPQQQAWGRPPQQQASGGQPQQQAWGRSPQQQASGGQPQQQAPIQPLQKAPMQPLQKAPMQPQAETSSQQSTSSIQVLGSQSEQIANWNVKTSEQLMALIPPKIKSGKRNTPLTLETNMFRLVFPKNFEKHVVHYDVIITPDKPKCLLRRVFEKFRQMQCPKRYPAFDGKKNAYSAKNLPFGDESPEVKVTILDMECNKEDKNRTFIVCLKKVADLDLGWLSDYSRGLTQYERTRRDMQALDIILRHGPSLHYTPVGRSLFAPPRQSYSLSDGLDLWVGMFSSVVIGSRPYVNIDVAHKGFPKQQPVVTLFEELGVNLNKEGMDYRTTEKTNFLKGLKVQYEIPGQPNSKRTYRVNGLVQCAKRNEFQYENRRYTIEEYFAQHKRYRIQYPYVPCLWVGSRNSKIYVPAELCTIMGGQVTQKKLNEEQTKRMIRAAATKPDERKHKILEKFAQMNLNDQPTLTNEFHLSVQGQFERVPARVLAAPTLHYNRPVTVAKGVWRIEEFLRKGELPDCSWTILNLDRGMQENTLYEFQAMLQRGGLALGMRIGRAFTPFQTILVQRDTRSITSYFERMKKTGIKMVIVILSTMSNAYSCVKQISELKVSGGIVTQCVKSHTLRSKMNPATISNILLKINSKLNGVNHVLDNRQLPKSLIDSPCIIVGADVTHPSPDSVNIPSIAAVAASIDTEGFKYRIELRLQPPREEIIQHLEQIMVIHLQAFERLTKTPPAKIIFYRDGVSEGDLPRVMKYELLAIRKAVASLHKGNLHAIPITFLVVQKRHHVRLFPTDKSKTDDKNQNVQAGTVVDTEITHPTQIDFYLVSHASIQGTARPTKYRCICNDLQLTEEEIETLTYYLCHMFARCTRSVSYPAPTYYAHLAAFRARAYIQDVPVDLNNLDREQHSKMNLQLNMESPMFFV